MWGEALGSEWDVKRLCVYSLSRISDCYTMYLHGICLAIVNLYEYRSHRPCHKIVRTRAPFPSLTFHFPDTFSPIKKLFLQPSILPINSIRSKNPTSNLWLLQTKCGLGKGCLACLVENLNLTQQIIWIINFSLPHTDRFFVLCSRQLRRP